MVPNETIGRMGKRRDKAWMFALAKAMQKNVPSKPAEPSPPISVKEPEIAILPFYESTLFWGALGAVIALLSVYLGFVLKDIRWFLAIAWPFCALTLVSLAKSIRKAKHLHFVRGLMVVVGSLACAGGLLLIAREAPPPNSLGVQQQLAELKTWIKDNFHPNINTGNAQTQEAKQDVDILNIDSSIGISIRNNSELHLTLLGVIMTLDFPPESESIDQVHDFAPRQSEQMIFDAIKKTQWDTMRPLSDTWIGQVEASKRAVGNCFAYWYLSPDSPSLKQVTDHYQSIYGAHVPTGNASGEVIYRVGNQKRTKKVKLKALTARIDGCVPTMRPQ